MALADLLAGGIKQAGPTLYDQYEERQRQYLADQQKKLMEGQQMELRDLQMQQARKEMEWGEQDRAIKAEDRQRKISDEALWSSWWAKADSISDPNERLKFYLRGRDKAFSMRDPDPQLIYSINQAIESMKPPEPKQYEPSTMYKDYLAMGGEASGMSFQQFYDKYKAKPAGTTPKRKALSSTERMTITSTIRGEDWYSDLDGDAAKKKNRNVPTGSKGAVEGMVSQLSNDLSQEYDTDPSSVSAELIQLLRQNVGIKEPEGVFTFGQRSTFDPVEFEEAARRHFSELSSRTESADIESIPTITTQEEYDSLPSGSIFIDSEDGQQYRKP